VAVASAGLLNKEYLNAVLIFLFICYVLISGYFSQNCMTLGVAKFNDIIFFYKFFHLGYIHTYNRFTAGLEYVRVHPGQQKKQFVDKALYKTVYW